MPRTPGGNACSGASGDVDVAAFARMRGCGHPPTEACPAPTSQPPKTFFSDRSKRIFRPGGARGRACVWARELPPGANCALIRGDLAMGALRGTRPVLLSSLRPTAARLPARVASLDRTYAPGATPNTSPSRLD